MKKLDINVHHAPIEVWATINVLIDEVAELKQQLADHVDHEARHVSEPVDDKPEAIEKLEYKVERLFRHNTKVWEKLEPADDKPKAETNDTHRTVTLRIPKGMRVGEAIMEAYICSKNTRQSPDITIYSVSDTDLQKALDEAQPNE